MSLSLFSLKSQFFLFMLLISLYMSMTKKSKKKVYSSLKTAKAIQRELEIEEHGKIISLRPSMIQDSKKSYKRNKKVNIDED